MPQSLVEIFPMKSNIQEPFSESSGKPYRSIFLVDDHPIFCEVLSKLLEESGDFKVVGSCGDGETAMVQLPGLKVDILILDLMLPGISGLEVLSRLRAIEFQGRTVVYSGGATDELVAAVFAQGVSAFVEKNARVEELLSSLRAVGRGESVMNLRMSSVIRTMVRQRVSCKLLTSHDLLILRLLALRYTAKEIGSEMKMSLSGVYKARQRIEERLVIQSRGDFFTMALKLGVVQGGDSKDLREQKKIAP
jgi:DNA-binding NarL/FixJ family response regulator